MDELNGLLYLDLVVREGLRVDSPVSASERVACEDCVIRVDNEYLDKYGRIRGEIRLNKGDAINKSKELQPVGRRRRGVHVTWEHPPEASNNIPGTHSNLLPFISGPHGCIGYRFAIAKAVLFTLIRSFKFALALPKEEIVRKTMIVGRPHVARELFKGPQMPLLRRPVSAE